MTRQEVEKSNEENRKEIARFRAQQESIQRTIDNLVAEMGKNSCAVCPLDGDFRCRACSEDEYRGFFDREYPGNRYGSHGREHSFDMVNRKFAQNSTTSLDDRYDLLDSVDLMFEIINKGN